MKKLVILVMTAEVNYCAGRNQRKARNKSCKEI